MSPTVFENAERAEREAMRLRRNRMKDHNKGEWSVSPKGGAIISDVKNRPEMEESDFKYYGGHLICESVYTAADSELIAAAPGMYHELLRQMREAWQRLDYRSADRIADLIGEVRPTDYEKEDL